MRKRVLVLVLLTLMLFLAPLQMFALQKSSDTNLEISPLWVSIIDFSNSFGISNSGLFDFDTALYARNNIDKVVITASIQQKINGSWKTIKTWTSTSNSNSGYLSQEWYVSSGYYYRLVSTGAVYDDGNLVEKTSFSGVNYWY